MISLCVTVQTLSVTNISLNRRAAVSKTSKPIIFISHVHEDADIAKALSDCISEAFLEAIDVFVSSDGSSIRGGDKWMEKIENNLRESRIVLVTHNRHGVI